MSMSIIEWLEEKRTNIMFELNAIEAELTSGARKLNYPLISKWLCDGNALEIKEYAEREFDAQAILYALRVYQDLMAEFNQRTVLVPSKENFCMLIGWNAQTFDLMEDSMNEEVRASMSLVVDYIVDSNISMGQSGDIRSNMTKFRLNAAGKHGHGIISEKDKKAEKKEKQTKSLEQIQKDLAELTMGD